jgi:uncharacterized protein YdeI (YjbR/CyaY-like superfamily)
MLTVSTVFDSGMRMAQVIPDPKKIKSFAAAAEFEKWLARHHDSESELWLRVYKKDSGRPTVTYADALEVVLCWGWIDGIRKSYDEISFLQRYSPRKSKSIWSHINREHVARLTAAGRMTPHGQKHIDAAKADGRWDAAYAPMRRCAAHPWIPSQQTCLPPLTRTLALARRSNYSTGTTCSRSRSEPTT